MAWEFTADHKLGKYKELKSMSYIMPYGNDIYFFKDIIWLTSLLRKYDYERPVIISSN